MEPALETKSIGLEEIRTPSPPLIEYSPFWITRVLHGLLPHSWTISYKHAHAPKSKRRASKYALNLPALADNLFFSSAFSLIWKSAIGCQLELDDFQPLPSSRHITSKTDAFNAAFSHFSGKDEKCNPRSRVPLLRALISVFRFHILEGTLCHFAFVCLGIGQAVLYMPLLEYLVKFYHQDTTSELPTFGDGAGLIVSLPVVLCIAQLLSNRAAYTMGVAGGEMKTLLAASIAIKSTVISPLAQKKLSESEKNQKIKHKTATKAKSRETVNIQDEKTDVNWSIGALMNLANTDSERIQLAMRNINDAWPPILTTISIGGLTYWLIRWPGMCSLAFTLVGSITLLPMVRGLSNLRLRINIATDDRVTKVTDLVNGIRFLKACAWEDVYYNIVRKARRQEIKLNRQKFKRTAMLIMVSDYLSRAPALLSVGLHTLISPTSIANSPNVLVYVALISTQSSTLWVAPTALMAVIDGWQSLRRIEAFLLAEELPEIQNREISAMKPGAPNSAIELDGAEFSWTRPQDEEGAESHFSLEPVTFSLHTGELVAIVGATSSGKSSLAAGFAGCMPLIGGKVSHSSSPIYVPAIPWIQSTTFRDNILFGLPFHMECYHRIIAACDLEKDISQFSSGDMTVVGEKGLTLSGGQRARVGLARGMYAALLPSSNTSGNDAQHQIIIVDDPLSALDARTSKSVFEDAILRSMAGLTRVLVTHQVQVLGRCDRIIWMDNGKIEAIGTFHELEEQVTAFRDFVGGKVQLASGDMETMEHAPKMIASPGRRGEEIMQEEEVRTNSVPASLLAAYVGLPSSIWMLILLLVLLVVAEVNFTLYNIVFAWWEALVYGLGNGEWAAILACVIFTHATTWGTYYIAAQTALLKCSEKAANEAMEGVLRAKTSFLDTTPVGRILNRFTQDVNEGDTVLSLYVWKLSIHLFASLTSIGFTIYYVPMVAAILVPWFAIVIFLGFLYRPTPLAIKRLEAPYSSFVSAHISEIISGASALRISPAARRIFIAGMYEKINALNQIHFASYATNAWVGVRGDTFSCLLQLSVGLLAIRLRHTIVPGVVMALLMNCFTLLAELRGGLSSLAEVQRGMNCIERLDHYAHGIEAERPNCPSFNVDKSWPSNGKIVFDNLSMRYRPKLPLAIRDLNMTILGGEKIGFVGRTGAGKSTIFSVLLGMVDPTQGSVSIDGLDITSIGVNDLRKKMAVIPQEPTLFAGTIRSNLDPRKERNEEELVRALARTGFLENRPGEDKSRSLDIDFILTPGGANLSSGQRQLLSLARAIVRKTRIILIDEATAGVDYEIDGRIQEMLRSEFEGRTVVTIAHRIHTVVGYDKIAVLDAGRLVEFGEPRSLWKDEKSLFRGLCDQSNVVETDFGQVKQQEDL